MNHHHHLRTTNFDPELSPNWINSVPSDLSSTFTNTIPSRLGRLRHHTCTFGKGLRQGWTQTKSRKFTSNTSHATYLMPFNLMQLRTFRSQRTYNLRSVQLEGQLQTSPTPSERQFSLFNLWQTQSDRGRLTKWSISSLSHQADCVYSGPTNHVAWVLCATPATLCCYNSTSGYSSTTMGNILTVLHSYPQRINYNDLSLEFDCCFRSNSSCQCFCQSSWSMYWQPRNKVPLSTIQTTQPWPSHEPLGLHGIRYESAISLNPFRVCRRIQPSGFRSTSWHSGSFLLCRPRAV